MFDIRKGGKDRHGSFDESPLTSDPERIVPGTPHWETDYPDHIQRYHFVAKRVPPGARVLDAGCGCGYGAAYLADYGAGCVVAVDVAAEALDIARQHFHRDQIVWLQDDCHVLEAAVRCAPFDVICNLENLEHLVEPERFLQRVTELLSPGGMLITSTPNRLLMNKLRGTSPDAPPTNPYHVREYTAEEFRTLLRAYFSDVTLWYQCRSAANRAQMSLEPVLWSLWHNPAMRLGRWMQLVFRRRRVPHNLYELLPPCHPEWEILENDPGVYVTQAFIAVCRSPRSSDPCIMANGLALGKQTEALA